MPTIYYEAGIPARLIPVQFLGYAETPGYQSGEVLHVPARSIVEKAGRRDYFQLVRAASLPSRTAENTRKARA